MNHAASSIDCWLWLQDSAKEGMQGLHQKACTTKAGSLAAPGRSPARCCWQTANADSNSTCTAPHTPCSQPHLATMTSAPSDLTHRSISSTQLQAGRAHRTLSHACEEHASSSGARAARIE